MDLNRSRDRLWGRELNFPSPAAPGQPDRGVFIPRSPHRGWSECLGRGARRVCRERGVPPRGDRDSIGHNERGGSADMSLTPPPAAIWCRKQPCGDGVLLLLCACPPPLLPAGVPGVRPGLPSASPSAHLGGDGPRKGGGCGGTICRGHPSGTRVPGSLPGKQRGRHASWVRGLPREWPQPSALSPARCRLH